MIVGQLSFVAVGAICVFASRDSLAGWGYGLASLFVLQGIGRSAYEGVNRATYASMFTADESAAAFATITVFGGLAGTVAYATFKDLVCVNNNNNNNNNNTKNVNNNNNNNNKIPFLQKRKKRTNFYWGRQRDRSCMRYYCTTTTARYSAAAP